jgi:hypothetical protein
MTDYGHLMDIFSRPRPNGSRAEVDTSSQIQEWLQKRGIPFHVHTFTLYPYFFECIGAWLILSRLALALVVWLRLGWISIPIAIIGLLGATLDQAFHIPLVTWFGARRGENIIVELGDDKPAREVIFSSHYDSKTELLDHNQRMFFLKNIPTGIILTIILGAIGPIDAWLTAQASPFASWVYWGGIVLSLPLLFLAGGLGINMLAGRLVKPSQGAVDNGGSCAVLLGLAEKLHEEESEAFSSKLEDTRITLALFTGEEVDRQGSRAYVSWRSSRPGGWAIPAAAVNLEVMAQDSDYVYWEKEGSVFKLEPTHPEVNQAIIEAVREVTGKDPLPGGPVISDGAPFMHAGIPTGVMGTLDSKFGFSGFHRPTDNRQRIVMERLPQGVEILRLLGERLKLENQVGSDPKNPTGG